MNQLKDEVIILKSINYSEADKILIVLGRNSGKFSLIAKGIRKIVSKNRGNMQTLTVSEVTYFEGRNMGILKESNAIVLVPPESIDMESAGRLLFLLTRLLPEGDPEEEIYDMVVKVVENGVQPADVNRFRIRFLQRLGYINDMGFCSVCGEKVGKSDWLDPHNFSVICESCSHGIHEMSRAALIKIGDMAIDSDRMSEMLDVEVKKVLEA